VSSEAAPAPPATNADTTNRDSPVEADPWPPPPTLRSVVDRFGSRFLVDSVIPVAVFVAVNSAGGLGPAMATSSA
jgi:hypothetical protein